jgi:murein DD-endopeptidase MepM/ murein hydrolase activator NlpD
VLDIHKIKELFKRAFTPITIMFVPHSKTRPLNIKVPFVGICASVVVCCFGIFYIFSIAVNTFEYHRMKNKLNYYSEQFSEMASSVSALKKAETEFKRLFSHGSKEKVLENIDPSDSGSLDIVNLKQNIKKTIETVGDIRDYLNVERDIFIATPKGFPVEGGISSHFGNRENPRNGDAQFHTGIDISSSPGTAVKATADGIVSFAGWNGGSGNLVVLEHGHGYSTFYAHNKMIIVKIGQKVKRGEVISHVGSTGYSTGPHVHYEIWKDGRPVDPVKFKYGRA